MHYIVLDLEATCWEKKAKKTNEIIEIGAVAVDHKMDILDEFNTFVKPMIHPILSDFCTQLTSIKQEDVDTAAMYPEVITNFQQWILEFGEDYFLCSWGYYDKNQFVQDCNLHSLDKDWLKNHISLKHQYGYLRNMRRPPGMKAALKLENIQLEGTHHRGIDDARNITKIFLKYFDLWEYKSTH